MVEHELPKREAGAETSLVDAGSSSEGGGQKLGETAQNQFGGTIRGDETPEARIAADATLLDYLKARATVLALTAPGALS